MKERLHHRLDLKEVSDEGEFVGYASKFDIADQGGDVVQKGAFTATLGTRTASQVKMLWQHSPSEPVGLWKSIEEDSIGLKVQGKLLLGVNRARETYELMKAGVVDGLSIGYRTIKSVRDDKGRRMLKELDLWEISLVTFPMLREATVDGVKGDWTERDAERVLRDAGMPNAMATRLVAGGWKAADTSGGQRDAANGLSDLAEQIRQMNENLKGKLK